MQTVATSRARLGGGGAPPRKGHQQGVAGIHALEQDLHRLPGVQDGEGGAGSDRLEDLIEDMRGALERLVGRIEVPGGGTAFGGLLLTEDARAARGPLR